MTSKEPIPPSGEANLKQAAAQTISLSIKVQQTAHLLFTRCSGVLQGTLLIGENEHVTQGAQTDPCQGGRGGQVVERRPRWKDPVVHVECVCVFQKFLTYNHSGHFHSATSHLQGSAGRALQALRTVNLHVSLTVNLHVSLTALPRGPGLHGKQTSSLPSNNSPWARYRNPPPPPPPGGNFGDNDFWIAQYVSFQYLLVCKMNYSAFRDYLRWYIAA